ncbi:hypothetical protein T439DRAFT_320003 [Meredithblackwellia eburnea MCA 4105]
MRNSSQVPNCAHPLAPILSRNAELRYKSKTWPRFDLRSCCSGKLFRSPRNPLGAAKRDPELHSVAMDVQKVGDDGVTVRSMLYGERHWSGRRRETRSADVYPSDLSSSGYRASPSDSNEMRSTFAIHALG